MLHKFLEDGDWFAPKKFGYGAGLPIAWQGWVLLLSYVGVMLGIGAALSMADFGWKVVAVITMTLATIAFTLIVKRRTRGGWKWRP